MEKKLRNFIPDFDQKSVCVCVCVCVCVEEGRSKQVSPKYKIRAGFE